MDRSKQLRSNVIVRLTMNSIQPITIGTGNYAGSLSAQQADNAATQIRHSTEQTFKRQTPPK